MSARSPADVSCVPCDLQGNAFTSSREIETLQAGFTARSVVGLVGAVTDAQLPAVRTEPKRRSVPGVLRSESLAVQRSQVHR